MNYCFLARPALNIFSPKLFLDIRDRYDRDAKGFFIVMNKKEADDVEKLVPDGKVYDVSIYMEQHWNDFSFERFCEFERKYDCAPIWQYIYTDRFLIERDYDYTIKTTTGLFAFFEDIFTNNYIDIYYSETIATLLCYIAYLVGKKTNTRFFAQTGARGCDGTHHYNINDPFNGVVGMKADYEHQSYSKEELLRAEDFLCSFEKKEIIPAYMQWTGRKPRFKWSFLLLPIKRLLSKYRRNNSNPYSYMYYKSYKHITDPFLFYIRYQRCKKYYKRADFNKKYVFYPLHYQPEASTIVCAQKYEKQLFYIDSWSKSLPADTLLYVKEHYAILGHRDPQFYKELRKYPNVVLVNPWESTRQLEMNAEAVTTLTGTAGWESMLLRKPVFLGGNVFFDNAPGVIKIKDIYGRYMNYISSWKKPSRESIINYLCSYFRAIKPGCPYGYGSEFSDTDENIKLMVDSLMSEIK